MMIYKIGVKQDISSQTIIFLILSSLNIGVILSFIK